MFNIYMTRLHELTVLVYALSVLLYFIDFLHHNRKANKVAFWLLAFVWVLQTTFFLFYVNHTGRFPVLTVFEGLYFYSWVLVTLSLVINKLLRMDFIVFFTNIIGFVIMAIHTFAPVQYHIRRFGRAAFFRIAFNSYYNGHPCPMEPSPCPLFFHYCT